MVASKAVLVTGAGSGIGRVIAALTRQIAANYASQNGCANAAAPGAVHTALSESQLRARARDDEHFQELLDGVMRRCPLEHWGEAAEIAEVVHFFLGTQRSAWMTGQILPVDGGLLELRRGLAGQQQRAHARIN